MNQSLRFILNDADIVTGVSPGETLLDFVRYHRHLVGTKIGCREGDCGACTVLVGEWYGEKTRYRSMTSCLMPLGNADGKHIVTIEGLNRAELNPIQTAMVAANATQCGFCTPGFVVSLAGFCLSAKDLSEEAATAAIDGNICRCTGYKSIQRAAQSVVAAIAERPVDDTLPWLVAQRFLPDYFTGIPARMAALNKIFAGREQVIGQKPATLVGGGTDLYVQKPHALVSAPLALTSSQPDLRRIQIKDGVCSLGAAVTAQDLRDSTALRDYFPRMVAFMKLVSSTPIRNMGTVAGNLVNASPIGDLTIFLLAFDTEVSLSQSDGSQRLVKLKDFFLGYKTLNKKDGETLLEIRFPLPNENHHFNFEKVSKRTHLDIASVNSAMGLEVVDGMIVRARVAAGGVAPVPLFLAETSLYLAGKSINLDTARAAAQLAIEEIAPIGDIRGSVEYKRLLLRQLIYAHFLTLFPANKNWEALV